MNDLAYWLLLFHAPGIGTKTFLQLLEQFVTPREIVANAADSLMSIGFTRQSTVDYLRNPDWSEVENDLSWAENSKNHIITLADPGYPQLLKEIADPPPVLFVHGTPAILLQPQLAIVGSRNPSRSGIETAYGFAESLSRHGLAITSGLAMGIDAASHRGALAAGGTTIAVVGTGLQRVYPARHKPLAHEIAAGGALVSEFPLHKPPLAANFPRRNRIISGLSIGTLVVEAALRSGALITARMATEQGREVFAMPGSIHNPLARGCHALIRQGAKLVETDHDILEELAHIYPIHLTVENGTILNNNELNQNLDTNHMKILNNLGFDPTPIDLLVERTGLAVNTISSLLLTLELQEQVSSSGGLYFRINSPTQTVQ